MVNIALTDLEADALRAIVRKLDGPPAVSPPPASGLELFETFDKLLPKEPPFALEMPLPAGLPYMEKVLGEEGVRLTVSAKQMKGRDGRVRTELRLLDPGKNARIYRVDPPGDRWVAVDLMVPASWRKDPNKVLLFQAHHAEPEDAGVARPKSGPPFQVFVWNDNLYLRLTNDSGYADMVKIALEKGKWLRFVSCVRWGVDGLCRVWINGWQVCNFRGQMGYEVAPKNWWGVGLYWPAATEDPVDYADGSWKHSVWYRLWQMSRAPLIP